ncbi:hypothetical protein [Paenibacillus sinopodophylli]|uniref:hypothetical protein n=1 Tax=Paenibacillus sinopodophylli TaxID=1837342 RepID=UPI00110CFB0E|nr:hypothetical protein [Paenibacillus sinopodophylli]
MKKNINFGYIILLFFICTILSSCGRDNMNSNKPSINFSELIENENIADIILTIYYVNPFILTRQPWSVGNLINSQSVKKIVISGSDLEEHFDLFNQINNDVLIPVKKESPNLDVRLYYVLDSKKNGKLFDVAMWGGGREGNTIFFNGYEVIGHGIFYDVVMSFLPEDAVKEFEKWKNEGQAGEDRP